MRYNKSFRDFSFGDSKGDSINCNGEHPSQASSILKKGIEVLFRYRRCFSLWPAPVPLYLLFVALNRYERVSPMR